MTERLLNYVPRNVSASRAQLPVRSAILSCLLPLFAACSATKPSPVLIRPEPPPPGLLAECSAGPAMPDGDLPVAVVSDVLRSRAKAAEACRLRHARLAAWACAATGCAGKN